MNVANLKRVMRRIQREPARNFRMSSWHCETSHCIGGWAQILAGKPQDNNRAFSDASFFLGLTFDRARRLLISTNWPYEFRDAYDASDSFAARKRIAMDRIRHFIKTKGRG